MNGSLHINLQSCDNSAAPPLVRSGGSSGEQLADMDERQHQEAYGHSKEGLRAEEEKRRGDLEDPEEFFIVVVVDTLCTSKWEWDTTLTF